MAMVSHKLLSPAKINLMLRVLDQRDDGYHNLQTIFQILDWGDEMLFSELSCDGSNKIEVSGFDDLPVKSNLIYQASQAIKKFAKNNSSWLIEVKKRIPTGGGLGGGSSNAATTLKFLNHYWQCELNHQELVELGSDLGADVPIFIMDKSALATGIGEQIEPMEFDTPYVLLVFPEISISTATLFTHKDLHRNQTALPIEYIKNSNYWINDFFPLLLNTEHKLADLYKKVKQFARFRLSGTGSTIFALFETAEEAETVSQSVKKYANCYVVKPKTVGWTATVG